MKVVLLIASFFACTSLLFSQENEPLNIYHQPAGDGGFQYFAENQDLAPYQLEIDFVELNNLKPTVALPYYAVVYPGSPQSLFQLKAASSGNTSFRSSFKLTIGDPDASVDTDFVYLLPYQHLRTYILAQGANGQYTHQGKYAWDFLMDEGTEICASRAGIVVSVKEDSNKGGADISYMDFANRITVLHADGSFADYAHLRQNGAIVEKGDEVKAGQLIGYSGNTGWSTRPHLHFQVYKAVKFGTQTLPVKFLNSTGEFTELEEQVSYQALHR
jgi:murein DD-endopeptidase MepM/ murein hydrolase activator NlpD